MKLKKKKIHKLFYIKQIVIKIIEIKFDRYKNWKNMKLKKKS